MSRTVLLLVLLLSACGQSGDLYLPDAKPDQAGAAHKDEPNKETR